ELLAQKAAVFEPSALAGNDPPTRRAGREPRKRKSFLIPPQSPVILSYPTLQFRAVNLQAAHDDDSEEGVPIDPAEVNDYLFLNSATQPDGKPQRLRESTLQRLRDFLEMFDLRTVVDDEDLKEPVDKSL